MFKFLRQCNEPFVPELDRNLATNHEVENIAFVSLVENIRVLQVQREFSNLGNFSDLLIFKSALFEKFDVFKLGQYPVIVSSASVF
jgi:hypothetical protein